MGPPRAPRRSRISLFRVRPSQAWGRPRHPPVLSNRSIDVKITGIGAFTVVDASRVTAADIGNNFFLTADSLGKPRSSCVTELLCEMNNEVGGFFLDEVVWQMGCSGYGMPTHGPPQDAIDVIERKPDFFQQFTLVIATDLPQEPLLKLANLLWIAKIPLMVARSYGFIGSIRVVVPEHVGAYNLANRGGFVIHVLMPSPRTASGRNRRPSSGLPFSGAAQLCCSV